ncbi:ABC transporter ATP-binding protein [Thioalkalicoccus limnaeus]|uniref:ABC-type dipeptide transporter n=1 Tax=Thioalkalicoccus limnaeus TaxID=120681 RepID=A0ABV4BGU7_9GAMM
MRQMHRASLTEPLLQVTDLTVEIRHASGNWRILDRVSLSVRAGETLALLGESGCGKTMAALALVRLLAAPVQITAGRIQLAGRDLVSLPESAMRRVRGGEIAMIFQEPQSALNPVMPIGRQIAEAVRLHAGQMASRDPMQRVVELLTEVGIPDPARRVDDYPHQLSGGMKQRVMIAMALAGRPKLLIADEPTTALDVTIQAQILALLKDLQQRTGMAILLITHDLGVVAQTADRLAVMYAGQIVETAPSGAFFAGPAHPYSLKLMLSRPTLARRGRALAVIPGRVPPLGHAHRGCRFAERCDRAHAACHQREPDWHPLNDAHRVRCHLWAAGQLAAAPPEAAAPEPARHPRGGAEPRLQVADLAIHFPIRRGFLGRTVGALKAVDGVSLTLHAGRTLALVGESGCGKTTVGLGLLGLVPTTAGAIRYAGHDLADLGERRMRPLRKDLQIVFQDPYASMNPRMRIGDIVAEGLLTLGLVRGRRARWRRAAELLEQVGLRPDDANRYPHQFSGGQRQRISIARALAVEPEIIVCDEPTSALDVSVQAQILNLLQELQSDRDLSFLFITHDLSVVSHMAHEVAVMYLGRIVERGRLDEVLGDPRHPYTKALLSAVPDADGQRPVIRLTGDLPSPAAPPAGCHFEPRCPEAQPACAMSYPGAVPISATHQAHCHRLGAAGTGEQRA